MEKIHSLTGMLDLIGHKTSKDDLAEKIFYTEEILRDIFESFSISEIRTPALESSSLFKRSSWRCFRYCKQGTIFFSR